MKDKKILCSSGVNYFEEYFNVNLTDWKANDQITREHIEKRNWENVETEKMDKYSSPFLWSNIVPVIPPSLITGKKKMYLISIFSCSVVDLRTNKQTLKDEWSIFYLYFSDLSRFYSTLSIYFFHSYFFSHMHSFLILSIFLQPFIFFNLSFFSILLVFFLFLIVFFQIFIFFNLSYFQSNSYFFYSY